MMEKEIWEPVRNRSNYVVSNHGRVYNAKTRRFCHGCLDKNYVRIHLYQDGKGCKRYLHCIVIDSFVGKKPSGNEVNHKDLNTKNNHLSNLEYVTPSSNSKHAMLLGRKAKKLTIKKVWRIRNLIQKGLSQYRIARMLKINQSCVSDVCTGVSWGWVKMETAGV